MESVGNEQINLLRWSDDGRQPSPSIDTFFYPHEVRNLVRRQKIIEAAISILLINVYGLILAGVGLSFYFFLDAQIAYNQDNPNSRVFSGSCVLNCGNSSSSSFYPCTVAYVFQFVVGLGAAILLLCSLVKSCCCKWYSKFTLSINFFLLVISLIFAVTVSIFLNAFYVASERSCVRNEDAMTSFYHAFITLWSVSGVVFMTIILEVIIACLVKACRRRMTYHRLE